MGKAISQRTGSFGFSSHLFEYSRPLSSCDGEPAPSLVLPVLEVMPFTLPGFPKGDFMAVPLGGSIGEVLAVDDPESGWVADS